MPSTRFFGSCQASTDISLPSGRIHDTSLAGAPGATGSPEKKRRRRKAAPEGQEELDVGAAEEETGKVEDAESLAEELQAEEFEEGEEE